MPIIFSYNRCRWLLKIDELNVDIGNFLDEKTVFVGQDDEKIIRRQDNVISL
ncbi:MAG: hypothetical protein Q4Q18_02500 [Methanobrevibacter sp.]|nr:hypothetical protein [Methanobrevibacter sp.]